MLALRKNVIILEEGLSWRSLKLNFGELYRASNPLLFLSLIFQSLSLFPHHRALLHSRLIQVELSVCGLKHQKLWAKIRISSFQVVYVSHFKSFMSLHWKVRVTPSYSDLGLQRPGSFSTCHLQKHNFDQLKQPKSCTKYWLTWGKFYVMWFFFVIYRVCTASEFTEPFTHVTLLYDDLAQQTHVFQRASACAIALV